jgi:hypothetical protein
VRIDNRPVADHQRPSGLVPPLPETACETSTGYIEPGSPRQIPGPSARTLTAKRDPVVEQVDSPLKERPFTPTGKPTTTRTTSTQSLGMQMRIAFP